MYCVQCDNKKPLKAKKVTRKFAESGLDNVVLEGVEEFTCTECGESYHGYGDLQQLHYLIAKNLIRQARMLLPKEVRYLRKYMGYSSSVFAEKILGIKRESYSRIENGKSVITPMLDHFVRALVAGKMPDRDYDLHDQFLTGAGEVFSRMAFRCDRKGWKMALRA